MRCSADIYRHYLFIFCVRPCGPGIERRSARQLQNHPWLEIHGSNVLGRTIIFPRLSPTQRSPDTFVDFCFFFSFFASTTRQFQLITECLPIKEAGLRRCPWKLFFPFFFSFYDRREWTVGCKSPRKSTLLFWCSIDFELQRRSNTTGSLCACGLNALCWSSESSHSIFHARSSLRYPIWDKIPGMIPYSGRVCFLMEAISALFICQSVWSVEASVAAQCEPVIVSVPFWPSRCFACERTWKGRRERWINRRTTFCLHHFWLRLPRDTEPTDMLTIDGEEKEKKSVFFFLFFPFFLFLGTAIKKINKKTEVQVQASSANQQHVHLRLKDVRDVWELIVNVHSQ